MTKFSIGEKVIGKANVGAEGTSFPVGRVIEVISQGRSTQYLVRWRDSAESTILEKNLWSADDSSDSDSEIEEASSSSGTGGGNSNSMNDAEPRVFNESYWTHSPSQEPPEVSGMDDSNIEGEVLFDLLSGPAPVRSRASTIHAGASTMEDEDNSEVEPAAKKKRGRPKGSTSSKKASKSAPDDNPSSSSRKETPPDWEHVNEVTEDLHKPTYRHRTKVEMPLCLRLNSVKIKVVN